jgi:DNA-binding MarR family transcriptional regulator
MIGRAGTTPRSEPPVSTPAATVAHAEAAARLRIAITRLNRALRQQSVGGLTLSQWSALVTVEGSEPLRIGDLADKEGVSAPTATRLVASLEEHGLVTREVGADRRSAYVSLTDAGREHLEWARQVRTAQLVQKLSRLDDADVARLLDVLPLLEALAGDDS